MTSASVVVVAMVMAYYVVVTSRLRLTRLACACVPADRRAGHLHDGIAHAPSWRCSSHSSWCSIDGTSTRDDS